MCAMPVNSDGESASAASAVSTGASSLISRRSAVMPPLRPVPAIPRPAWGCLQLAPILLSTSRILPAPRPLAAGPPRKGTGPPVTGAAADPAAAVDDEGNGPAATVADLDPGLAEPGEQLADGALRCPQVAGELNLGGRERRCGGNEPEYGASIPDIHGRLARCPARR